MTFYTLKDRSINTTRDYVICTAKKTIFCVFFIRFVNKVDRACLEQRENESKKAPIKFRLIYCSHLQKEGESQIRQNHFVLELGEQQNQRKFE